MQDPFSKFCQVKLKSADPGLTYEKACDIIKDYLPEFLGQEHVRFLVGISRAVFEGHFRPRFSTSGRVLL